MAHEKDGNIILIVDHGFDSESTDDRDDSKEEFVFRTRGQTEEEPLQLELALKTANSEDDHTNETCEISSHTSSQSHDDVEIGQSHDEDMSTAAAAVDSENKESSSSLPPWLHDFIWLMICFAGIMASFVAYGILLEFATSGGRRLHERESYVEDLMLRILAALSLSYTLYCLAVSFLFVTSVLGTITAWIGRTARRETISDIPANRFLALGLMSIGSTFCAIRALRYVIFPIQVLARSCKPVPVMLIGTLLGKKYARRKYISVFLVVCGVALFMGGGNIFKSDSSDDSESASSDSNGASGSSSSDDVVPVHQQLFGVLLLVASLFCDGGTGAYEDKLMSIHSMEPFDLMYKFQLSKTLTSGVLLIVFNQWHFFFDMIQQAGICKLLLILDLTDDI